MALSIANYGAPERLPMLRKRHRELEEELKACQEALEQVKSKFQKINEEKEVAQRIIDYQKFMDGDKTVYDQYLDRRLRELQQREKHGLTYSIRYGRKFDTVVRSHRDVFKVDKRTGDEHHLQQPQQNLIYPSSL